MDPGGGDMDMDMAGMSMVFGPWSQFQLKGAFCGLVRVFGSIV